MRWLLRPFPIALRLERTVSYCDELCRVVGLIITQWSVIKTTTVPINPVWNKDNKDVVFSKLPTCE